MRFATTILREAASLFETRNKVYKDTTGAVGEILAVLKRTGLMRLETPDDFRRYHILVLIIVKLVRYCNNWNPVKTKLEEDSSGAEIEIVGHQDSIRDMTVYSGILESIDQEINEEQVPF